MPCTTAAQAEQALAHLDYFCTRFLQGALRRIAMWKGLHLERHPDLVDDVRQELVLDCLQHDAEICGLPERARHARWFRLIERQLYQLHLRGGRTGRRENADHVADCGPMPSLAALLPDMTVEDRELLRSLLEGSARHDNGRCNVTGSAVQMGVGVRRVRRLWKDVAAELGYGSDFIVFWQKRLAEAALGLAADLLRDSGGLHILDEKRRPRPDPQARMRRIRRIQAAIGVRPVPLEMRRWLRQLGRVGRDLGGVHRLLDGAEALAPDHRAVHLWRFEACVLAADWPGAARSLRAARRVDAPAVPVLLARARLLEARGRERAALHLLSRSVQRHRADGRIVRALRMLEG
jgi:hypothetical protein